MRQAWRSYARPDPRDRVGHNHAFRQVGSERFSLAGNADAAVPAALRHAQLRVVGKAERGTLISQCGLRMAFVPAKF